MLNNLAEEMQHRELPQENTERGDCVWSSVCKVCLYQNVNQHGMNWIRLFSDARKKVNVRLRSRTTSLSSVILEMQLIIYHD